MKLKQAGLLAWLAVVGLSCGGAEAASLPVRSSDGLVPSMIIPDISAGVPRSITIDDLAGLRDIDTLSVSADGSHFAIRVRQGDRLTNDYRIAWFVGATGGGPLIYVGDGGQASLLLMPDGRTVGDLGSGVAHWSADGQWIAYTLKRAGEVQLWRSRVDGSVQEQVSHNAADVRDFGWSEAGGTLLFSVGRARAELDAREQAGRRNGYLLDEFMVLDEIIYRGTPPRPLESDLEVWAVDADGRHERRADLQEREEFARIQQRGFTLMAGGTEMRLDRSSLAAPPVRGPKGVLAWLARANCTDEGMFKSVRLTASLSPDGAQPITCTAPECTAHFIRKVWWSADGKRVIFWRKEGVNQTEDGIYSWSPSSGAVVLIFRSEEVWFRDCEFAAVGKLVCLRETSTRPSHVVALDTKSGRSEVLADVNPELHNVRFGKVERFDWKLPKDIAGLGYPHTARGFILYPPDFDPKRRYPAVICPYSANGFKRGDVGDEQPMPAYAANGFIVINTEFPVPWRAFSSEAGVKAMQTMYSPQLGFPHLTLLMESTFIALNVVIARGLVDEHRVGIGGVSHGTFVPLFMLQKYDRLGAVAVSADGWSQASYYYPTKKGRENYALQMGAGEPWPEEAAFWSQIDIADHVEMIEAPILFNFADRETLTAARLIRRLDDAHKAYDAYIFPDEHHVKWQPAHRYATYRRNLDWFRFWLQDYEDPAAEKADQYARWRQLRKLQCQNSRSLRNYCGIN